MDDRIEDVINGASGHLGLLDALMKLSANDLVYLAPLLMLALWFWPTSTPARAFNQRLALVAGLSTLLAVVLAAALAHVYSDARPFVSDGATRLLIQHEADNGFPSDHAAFAFAVAGATLSWRRQLGIAVLVLAAVNGFARIYVGVHWPSDVLAGAAVGLGGGLFVARLLPLLEKPQRWASRVLPPFLLATS